MCIIVYKPQGVAIPSTLKNCWQNNPDGAGYCYPSGKKNVPIRIKKGFMEWEAFESSIASVHNPEDVDMLFHFRIATHGGVNKAFCHPFPLSNSLTKLTSPRINTQMAICHNGIISEFGNTKVSDTAEYIQKVLTPLFKATNMIQSDETDTIIENTISCSRFAIMTEDGVNLIGNWQEHDGCWYSNGNYTPPISYSWSGVYGSKYGYGSSYGYEDCDYDDEGYGLLQEYYSTAEADAKTDTDEKAGAEDECRDITYLQLRKLPVGTFYSCGGYVFSANEYEWFVMDEDGLLYEPSVFAREVFEMSDCELVDENGNRLSDYDILSLYRKSAPAGETAVLI